MSTLKGIFEPFKDYVQKQLRVRRVIMANSNPLFIPKLGGDGGFIEGPPDFAYGHNEDARSHVYPEESFFAYSTEKQCTLRMMSGVDIRKDAEHILQAEAADPNLSYLRWNPQGLAKQYILESGTQYYNEGGDYGGLREGFRPENNTDYERAFAYGDKNIRANAGDDFGIVPMPGIVDAEIRTKSDNGSLREAKVNFVCHNRRQLEVLEMLFMRPGYPICLEWGWNPYIDNDGNRKNNEFSIREEFFDPEQTFENLNAQIVKYKKLTGGNFDGFIGYCKNFNFKANEIGGYECTTEIIAHGEILESLKTQKTSKNLGNLDYSKIAEIEVQDSLLYYLRSIKNSLRTPQDIQFLDHLNISHEDHGDIGKYERDIWDKMRTDIGYVGNGCPRYFKGNRLLHINYGQVDLFNCVYENNVSIPIRIDESVLLKDVDWMPGPIDSELLEDETETVTVNRDYIKNMSYDEYSYLYQSGQGMTSNLSPMNYGILAPGYGVFGENRTWDDSAWLKNHAHYQWAKWSKSGHANNFVRGIQGFFENGEWGIQREALIHRKVVTTTGDGSEEHKQAIKEGRAEAIKNTKDQLTLIDTKLKNYQKGYLDVIHLWQYINKIKFDNLKEELEANDVPKPHAGVGFESFLGGSILKQTIKGETGEVSSGYRRNIYIRWDLMCQMINHLCTYKKERASDIRGKNEKENLKEYLKTYKLKNPDMEFTYMNPNSRTWNNDSKKSMATYSFYLPYTAPYITETDPIKESILPTALSPWSAKDFEFKNNLVLGKDTRLSADIRRKLELLQKDEINYGMAQTDALSVNIPQLDLTKLKQITPNTDNTSPDTAAINEDELTRKKLKEGDYHPLIGASLDLGVCLMPHQAAFDTLFNEDMTYYDSSIMESYGEEDIWDKDADGNYDDAKIGNVIDRKNDRLIGEKAKFRSISSYYDIQNKNERHSIGYVYFNIDYVIRTFEDQRLRQMEAKATEKHTTLNNDFDMFTYVETLWNGVNTACGNYYNFMIHTEHERPNINRIIDLRISGQPNENPPIFEFDPQGLRSVTRQFYYDSAISSDLASAIAIAASNPSDMNEIDALSFKAFNKNIKSRWNKYDPYDKEKANKLLKTELEEDVQKYTAIFNQLNFYLFKLYEGNLQYEYIMTKDGSKIPYVNMGAALGMLNQLRELRTNINNRVPLKDIDGNANDGKNGRDIAGRWLTEVTNEISPIIPIQFNIQMDGIAGMLPLNLFKVNKSKLPMGYKADNIAFVIKSEQHKITSNQDWIVSIKGQMCLLNTAPNRGNNELENVDGIDLSSRKKPEKPTNEKISTNADLVRNVIVPLGHGENNYVGSKPGYDSGELSSGGDISPQLKDFIIFMVKALADPSVAGFEHPLSDQKLHFTGGNDIYHQQKHPNSKHVSGNGVDFILKGGAGNDKLDMMLAFLVKIRDSRYPKLKIKDEYRFPSESGPFQSLHAKNKHTSGAHIHLQLY